jgi:hypothetical protein
MHCQVHFATLGTVKVIAGLHHDGANAMHTNRGVIGEGKILQSRLSHLALDVLPPAQPWWQRAVVIFLALSGARAAWNVPPNCGGHPAHQNALLHAGAA